MNISEAVYCQKDEVISLNGLFHKMSIFNQDNILHSPSGWAMTPGKLYYITSTIADCGRN